ncbi:zinc finger CCCH domain-containing protein 17-like [Amaranthus tricolor]|uniref:zinc finger CCCH domain-containing protein 17-like n=1 Tax=Amaranthus tricolor TaxID=29722 RepID=UPI002590DBBB|nr:zinc finger CCCH domain-containing protein 17-like [Amaranthus tricolor]
MAATTAITKEPQQGGGGPSSSSSNMAEDESLKRNTDCVYFLASPLTCKKGNECEYRHSEYARINPRDCWYWLNGNCLNPKCSFRHPPLDGLVSPKAGNFSGPSVIVPPIPPVPATPQNSSKQGVPCIFFQKGYCLKADRCPFMHGPNHPSTKTQQVPASNIAPEAPVFKKTFGTNEKRTQQKTNLQVTTTKVVEAPPPKTTILKGQSSRTVNGESAGRAYIPPGGVIEEFPKYEKLKPFSVNNGILRGRNGRAHDGGLYDDQKFQNGREADDSLRDSSPGFDVLVDDKLNEDEYYPDDQYVRMKGRDGRNLKEFDMGHQDDYNSIGDFDPEFNHSRRLYDSFDHLSENYALDHHRPSSERSLGEPADYDRRGSYKSQSPDFNQNSDLRNRLSKQHRVNGLKSVVNSDYSIDEYAENQGYRSTQRNSRRSPIHEASRSHRLQDRIKIPRRSSPVRGNMYSERENERGRSWGRSSPSRPQVYGQQGHLRDRLRGRIKDESREGRKINGPPVRKDTVAAVGTDFPSPKRLLELKGTKQSGYGGKIRDTVLASSNATDNDLSFEGPKPLSEILKRKRKAPTSTNSANKEEIKQSENDVNITSSASNSDANTVKQTTLSSASDKNKAGEIDNKPLAVEAVEEEGVISNKKIKLNGDSEAESSSPKTDGNHPKVEEELIVADNADQEYDEEYEQDDGTYEYEQFDGEGETGYNEVDSMDEEDGDHFAKQLGVSF